METMSPLFTHKKTEARHNIRYSTDGRAHRADGIRNNSIK